MFSRTPSMTLRSLLLSLQQLLQSDVLNANDPQDNIVARQLISDVNMFKETARFWSMAFADAPGPRNEELWSKLNHLIELGISEKTSNF